MKVLDGRLIKNKEFNKLKKKMETENLELGLTVIQIGEDSASTIYIKQKEKMARELNIKFNLIKFSKNVSEQTILDKIDLLNKDDKVDGILVELPLPKNLNIDNIQNRIDPLKDVDGLTDINIGRLVHNKFYLISPTAVGIIKLLEEYNITLEGKNITIIGRSNLVGKPLAMLMNHYNATVSLCHSKTKNIKDYTKNADILIVAVGIENFIKKSDIKENAVVIDAGIHYHEDGTICGDVAYEEVKDKTSFITPVPGGVGQMTILSLAENIYKAHKLRKKE